MYITLHLTSVRICCYQTSLFHRTLHMWHYAYSSCGGFWFASPRTCLLCCLVAFAILFCFLPVVAALRQFGMDLLMHEPVLHVDSWWIGLYFIHAWILSMHLACMPLYDVCNTSLHYQGLAFLVVAALASWCLHYPPHCVTPLGYSLCEPTVLSFASVLFVCEGVRILTLFTLRDVVAWRRMA